ncbi:MAG TPA: hypothetical protein VGB52_04930 [Actinomycetota bacterium]
MEQRPAEGVQAFPAAGRRSIAATMAAPNHLHPKALERGVTMYA